jgi:hypothetical protein
MRRVPCALLWLVVATSLAASELTFQHQVIDPANPTDPHCKTLGDLDGDGLLDAVVASSAGGGLFWYQYPSWTKHAIRASGSYTTDMQVGDIDGDGDLDVVIPDDSALKWYENPRPGGDPTVDPWAEHVIGAAGADNHDVEVADVEPDGDLDVLTRRKGGGGTYFWRQTAAGTWDQVTITTASGEGVGVGDLDGDGDLDVAQNGFWSEQLSPTSWSDHTIDTNWPGDVGALVGDLDGDGIRDVVLAPSESTGRLSWYEAIDPVNGPWIEHSIDPTVSYLHTFKAADVDHDGDLDLVTAEMHQSADPDEVSVYFNDGSGQAWSQLVVAGSGSHNVRVGDIGGDGDVDIFGANWNDAAPNSAVIEMWENQAAPLSLDGWQRHVVETALPWNAVLVEGRDLDGDGLPDLVAGGWWWPNPGAAAGLGGTWTRQTIGAPLHNVAAVHDFDNDGDLDLLATDGQPGGEDFWWAENDGEGSFTLRDITHAAIGGDFLQGVAVRQITVGDREEILLSWHNGASGTAAFTVPEDPTTAAWPLATLSATTNMEQAPVGDLDGDGDADVHLGTSWLRQEAGGTFSTQSGITLSGGGVPDRVVLADLDGDQDLDVVIGVEFANALVWGENDGSGGGWTEHVIATDFDYFSVGAADMDHDGDVDVVGGAHMGNGEVTLYENDGTGLSWTPHAIDTGDSAVIDHHDGTVLVDMDLDRDLDVISVGWSKLSLVIYENLAFDPASSGDVTPPEIASVAAWGPAGATEVVVDFSEPVAEGGAEDTTHYSVSEGVVVGAATLAANGRAVTLSTSPLAPGVEYALSVDAVEDLAANPIAPGATAFFELSVGSPESELVAWWPFDEGTGSVAADASGHGHTGYLSDALAGGPDWVPGSSLDFDGVDDFVDAGAFDVTGTELTLAAWIRPEAFTHCGSRDCRILSKATGTAENDHWFMLSTIAVGVETRLRFRLKTGGTTTTLIASSGALTLGQWRHVAAVYDGSTMTLLLDGTPVGSTAKTGALSGDPSVPVWIGRNPGAPGTQPWAGRIDDARIYARALTPGELQLLPPPSELLTFEDGFESDGLAPWDPTGGVESLSAAAAAGVRGARVPLGSSCSGEAVVSLEPPPFTVQGLHEACVELTAAGVEVVAPGAELRAGESIHLGEGFSASADLTLELDAALVPFAWLRSPSWGEATEFAVELWLRLDGMSLAGGDRLEHLVARAADARETFRLVLEPDGAAGIRAVLEARLDGGSYALTVPGGEAPMPTGWRRLTLMWQAAGGNGRLALFVDGVLATELVGLANAGQRVAGVDWGVVGGDLAGAAGFLEIDGFRSW